ncbi:MULTISPECIES: S8 family serine peptidase [Kitasatospora]|uniref:Putative peptidase S08 family protein n=1 Tax=Kitasatospora setae (strain ATCC 33774 / DSM 43861 / JCM 3304 / KCC A-0304 / NBRC 14216 / KM-6054) TaxID=452652 RepID=E4NHZ8_KITSK|nr:MULTISPECIES: S8 family serine peptidase [Kitasatospora]BAJ31128.1 putative peptidase S08 family protein [Kitasatospora setae KM-6054]
MEQVSHAHSSTPATRRRRSVRVLGATLLTGLLLGGAVPYVTGNGGTYLSYLVLDERTDAEGAEHAGEQARALGGRVVQDYPQIGAVLAYAGPRFAEKLRQRPGIAAVGATRTVPVPSPPRPLAGAGFDAHAGGAGAAGAPGPAGDAVERADDSTPTVPDPGERTDWNLAMIGALDRPAGRTAALLRPPVGTAGNAAEQPSADRAGALPTAGQLAGVTVAVLDSGVDDTHPDLRAAVDPAASASCADGRPDSRDGAWRPDPAINESGHGTHVAGIVGAARDGRGVTGVAPGVRIAAVRLLGPLGQYYAENIVCGMIWAADHGARAINDSYFADPWKYNCPEDADQAALAAAVGRAVAYAQRKGAVVVASAGNDGQDLNAGREDRRSPNDRTTAPPEDRRLGTECIRLPGELPGVVTVTAVDRDGRPALYSNHGRGKVSLAAPGGDPDGGNQGAIVSDWPGGRYAALAGTSMSAAHVTGAVAVVAARHPDWGPDRITAALARAAAANGCDRTLPLGCQDRDYYGAGILILPAD